MRAPCRPCTGPSAGPKNRVRQCRRQPGSEGVQDGRLSPLRPVRQVLQGDGLPDPSCQRPRATAAPTLAVVVLTPGAALLQGRRLVLAHWRQRLAQWVSESVAAYVLAKERASSPRPERRATGASVWAPARVLSLAAIRGGWHGRRRDNSWRGRYASRPRAPPPSTRWPTTRPVYADPPATSGLASRPGPWTAWRSSITSPRRTRQDAARPLGQLGHG